MRNKNLHPKKIPQVKPERQEEKTELTKKSIQNQTKKDEVRKKRITKTHTDFSIPSCQ